VLKLGLEQEIKEYEEKSGVRLGEKSILMTNNFYYKEMHN